MKNLVIVIALFISAVSTSYAQVNPNSTYVNGYTRSNGTYVSGHYKTTSNNTINDNYTTRPNVNPYTGTAGTIQPSYSTSSRPAKSTYSTGGYGNDLYTKPTRTTSLNW
jgi:hypothetical protein